MKSGWSLFARCLSLEVGEVVGDLDIEVFKRERLAVLKGLTPRLLSMERSEEKAKEGAEARG